jgi:3-oxoacyl-[acyl-carrier protein] reductase
MDMLENQGAIIFGGTGRVGSVIAKALSAKGAKVMIHYNKNAEAAKKLISQISAAGGSAEARRADITNGKAVETLMKATANLFGAVHIIVNTVHGSSDLKPVIDMNWLDWKVHLDALKGHFFICKSILPYMRKQLYGRIIYISGGLSSRFFKGCSAYTTIKAGLNGFCKALALEEGGYNITVNIVAPGKVTMDDSAKLKDPAVKWDERGKFNSKSIPLQRFATAKDVANAVLYFASPGASGITGQTLFVAGGEIMP